MLSAQDVGICCGKGDKECDVKTAEKPKGERSLLSMENPLNSKEDKVEKMQIKILERNRNEMKIEIKGVGHSFCNLLQKALLNEDGIEMTGYDLPHPLVSNPIVYVRTKENLKSETVIQNAVKRIRKQNKDFRRTFEKALEK